MSYQCSYLPPPRRSGIYLATIPLYSYFHLTERMLKINSYNKNRQHSSRQLNVRDTYAQLPRIRTKVKYVSTLSIKVPDPYAQP